MQSDHNPALEHPSTNKETFLSQLFCFKIDIRNKFILTSNRTVNEVWLLQLDQSATSDTLIILTINKKFWFYRIL